MRLKFTPLLFLLLSLLAIMLYSSCRKTDELVKENNVKTTEERFFTGHRSNDAVENALVNYIKQQNNQLHFVEKTVGQIGYPRWNKGITIKSKQPNISGRETSGSDSSTLYYIPFVRDSQNYVNASMVIAASATDTSFWYYCDWQYRQLNNSASNQVDEAEQLAFFFMKLDNTVFGHKKFRITDTTLFNIENNIATRVQLDTVPPNVNELDHVFTCENVLVTSEVPCDLRTTGGGTRPHCYHTTWTYLCWYEEVYAPGGGGGGGGNGSGGSSGTPPDCDEPQGRGIAGRGNLPCEEEPGWEPEILPIEDPYDPCEVLKAKNNDTAYTNKLNYLKTKTGLTVETGFGETKTGVFTALVPGQSTNNTDNLTAPIDSTTRGFSHTHLNNYEEQVVDGPYAQQTRYRTPIRMFSPADVDKLMLMAHQNRFNGDYSQYYVTMVTANGTYTLKFTGTSSDISVGYGSRAWRNRFVDDFEETPKRGRNNPAKLEKFFLKFLKERMQLNSVSLYKINANGTVEEKKLDASGEVMSIPCP